MNVIKFSIPEIIFGVGSIKYIGLCAKQLGAKKVFVVSDPGLEKAGWVSRLIELIERDTLRWSYFSDVVSNPRDYQVHKGVEKYLSEDADVIIALGGGSPMDTAKGIAIIASNGGQIKDYEGANKIFKPLPPMLFIPSTAGSGSDISQFAIITDVKRQVKMSIISRTLMPNISIIDPTLLTTKTEDLIISSALDALCHAIESYISKIAFPFTESQSLLAIRLIFDNLRPAVETKDIKYLTQLSIASAAAGMAFSNASLGAVHALAHALGGMFDTMHGLVHPVLLPHILRFNLPACTDKLSHIGKIFNSDGVESIDEPALKAIKSIEEFFSQFNINLRLSSIVNDSSKLENLCKMAANDACLLTNPREVTWEDLLAICKEAW